MARRQLMIFMFSVMTATAARCPEGFLYWYKCSQQAKPSCYKFVKTEMSWLEARKNCQKFGGDLVSIETSSENAHLTSIISSDPSLQEPDMTSYRYWGYWTGGNDLLTEGVWRWAASNMSLSFTNWNQGEPNNYFGGREHCVQLRQNRDWKWNDMICSEEFQGSICEAEGS